MSTTAANPASVSTWNVDPVHSHAEFKVKHMMISNVKGNFSGLAGQLALHDSDHSLTRIDASVDVSTLSTGDAQRDGHLKSAEFFDAGNFPKMTFVSTRVERKADGDYAVSGDLTVHGVTKPTTFAVTDVSEPAKDPWGNMRIGVAATTKINRKDFGLTWNAALETGGVLVGEEIAISLEVQFIRA